MTDWVYLTDSPAWNDGKYVPRLLVFDGTSGEKVNEIVLECKFASRLVLSPDNTILVVASESAGALVINPQTLAITRTLAAGTSVLCVAFSILDDGNFLASGGGASGRIKLYDARDEFAELASIQAHDNKCVVSICFSSSSSLLVTGAQDRTAIIWRVPSLEIVHQLRHHTGYIYGAIFLTDDVLVTASDDKKVCVYTQSSGTVQVIGEHTHPVHCICLSPDLSTFATGGTDMTVIIYSAVTCERLHMFALLHPAHSICFKGEDQVIVGFFDKVCHAQVIDVRTGEIVLSVAKQNSSNLTQTKGIAATYPGMYRRHNSNST